MLSTGLHFASESTAIILCELELSFGNRMRWFER